MRNLFSKSIKAAFILGLAFLATSCSGNLDIRSEKDMVKADAILKPILKDVRVKSITLYPANTKTFGFDAKEAYCTFVNPEDSTEYKKSTIDFSKGKEIHSSSQQRMPRQIASGQEIPENFSLAAVSKVVNAAVKEIEAKGIAVDGVRCSIDFDKNDISKSVINVRAQHQEDSKRNGRQVTVYYSEVFVKGTLDGEIILIDYKEFEKDE